MVASSDLAAWIIAGGTILLLALAAFSYFSTLSWNLTARARWLKYLGKEIPRFKDYVDLVLPENTKKLNKGLVPRLSSFLPLSVTIVAILVWSALVAPLGVNVTFAYFLVVLAATILVGSLFRKSAFEFATAEENLRSLAIASKFSEMEGQSLQTAVAIITLDVQPAILILGLIIPTSFSGLLSLVILPWPWGILTLVLFSAGFSISMFALFRYHRKTKFLSDNALFDAMRNGSPPMKVHIDLLCAGGIHLTDEEIVTVGETLRIRNEDGREMDLLWRRIEALGVKVRLVPW